MAARVARPRAVGDHSLEPGDSPSIERSAIAQPRGDREDQRQRLPNLLAARRYHRGDTARAGRLLGVLDETLEPCRERTALPGRCELESACGMSRRAPGVNALSELAIDPRRAQMSQQPSRWGISAAKPPPRKRGRKKHRHALLSSLRFRRVQTQPSGIQRSPARRRQATPLQRATSLETDHHGTAQRAPGPDPAPGPRSRGRPRRQANRRVPVCTRATGAHQRAAQRPTRPDRAHQRRRDGRGEKEAASCDPCRARTIRADQASRLNQDAMYHRFSPSSPPRAPALLIAQASRPAASLPSFARLAGRARRPRRRSHRHPGGEHARGEYEGRATRRRDTCIVRIAVLKANAVDALAFVPTQQQAGAGVDARYPPGSDSQCVCWRAGSGPTEQAARLATSHHFRLARRAHADRISLSRSRLRGCCVDERAGVSPPAGARMPCGRTRSRVRRR